MSDNEEENQSDSSKEYEMPEGIPAPPLPKPDSFDLKNLQEGTSEAYSKKAGKKEKPHPTDIYNASRNMKHKKGGKACGCLGCFGLIILLLIAAVAGGAYYMAGDLISQGYKTVQLSGANETISTSPDEPTLYIGQTVTYDAPVTDVEIAILANEITFSGDFLEKASFRGAKVTGKADARTAKELNIIAVEFIDEGITANEGVTGRVMQNK